MSREIKFRAWDSYNECLVKVIDIRFEDKIAYVESLNELNEGERYDISLDNLDLMQFIGLKDKNGVEIYEGYIISWKEHVFMYGTDLNEWVTEKTAVEYSGIGAFVIWNNGEILYPTNEKSVVIGNIYENPELLEASK